MYSSTPTPLNPVGFKNDDLFPAIIDSGSTRLGPLQGCCGCRGEVGHLNRSWIASATIAAAERLMRC